MDDLCLTLRVRAVSSHGFPNVQIPWHPEFFEATNEGYEKALERMEELWQDALNRRITLWIHKPLNSEDTRTALIPGDDNIILEDWDKDPIP